MYNKIDASRSCSRMKRNANRLGWNSEIECAKGPISDLFVHSNALKWALSVLLHLLLRGWPRRTPGSYCLRSEATSSPQKNKRIILYEFVSISHCHSFQWRRPKMTDLFALPSFCLPVKRTGLVLIRKFSHNISSIFRCFIHGGWARKVSIQFDDIFILKELALFDREDRYIRSFEVS